MTVVCSLVDLVGVVCDAVTRVRLHSLLGPMMDGDSAMERKAAESSGTAAESLAAGGRVVNKQPITTRLPDDDLIALRRFLLCLAQVCAVTARADIHCTSLLLTLALTFAANLVGQDFYLSVPRRACVQSFGSRLGTATSSSSGHADDDLGGSR